MVRGGKLAEQDDCIGACTVAKRVDNICMHPSLHNFREAVAQVCQRHDVHSLEVFGSATGDEFDPSRSDIDLIVKFSHRAGPALFEHYFGLKQQLEAVFNRPVDLVMEGALRNPHFIQAVNRTRESIYASPQPEAA